MNFEQPPIPPQEKESNNEQNRIQITMEDVKKYNKSVANQEELKNWMDEKGIEFDQGMIKVQIDGENYLFNTDRDDFGTISYPDDEIVGQEKE